MIPSDSFGADGQVRFILLLLRAENRKLLTEAKTGVGWISRDLKGTLW